MSITINGLDIEIDSGFATGFASGGSVNTLTGSGFSTSWASRIIYLTGGTGAGQSRCVLSSTSSTVTVYEDWETQPDNTTGFTISYDVTDLTDVPENGGVEAVYIGDPRGKIVAVEVGSVEVKSGGVFGGVKNSLIFNTDKKRLKSNAGGFVQFGMSIDGKGREGGTITLCNHGNTLSEGSTNAYVEVALEGTTRFYGLDIINKMQGTAYGSNKLSRINQKVNPDEFTAYDCTFRDIVLLEDSNTDTKNCNFFGERSGLMTLEQPINSFGHKVFSGILSPRSDQNDLQGADVFDLAYFGDAPNDPLFNTPVFLYQFYEEAYFWNTSFPVGYDKAFKWHNNDGTGIMYEGYSVDIKIQDSTGVPVEDALIALIDVNGDAGWTTGKNASPYSPIKTKTLTSNSDGTIISTSIGTNEKGLVITNDWTKIAIDTSEAVSYEPFSLYIKKYGIIPIAKTNLSYSSRSTELLGASDNVRLVSTKAQASAILGITLDFTNKSIVITGDTNSQTLFDFYHHELAQTANSTADDDMFVIDFVNIGSWSLTLNGCTYTGAITTTSTITRLNGAKATGALTDSSGTILPDKTLTVQVNQTGADVFILEAGTNIVIASVDAQASNDFEYVYVGAQYVDIGVVLQGYTPNFSYGYYLSGENQTLPIQLIFDRNYL